MDSREEKNIISAFFEYERRQELQQLSASEAKRELFIESIFDSKDLVDSCKSKIPPGDSLAKKIHELLSALGAPAKCYVISENDEIDGSQQELNQVLDIIVESGDATILSCIPGKLAYYEGIAINERYLLKK